MRRATVASASFVLLVSSFVAVALPASTATALGRLAPAGTRCFTVAGSPGDIAVVNLTPLRADTTGFGSLV